MTTPICAKCRREIPVQDVNVATDVAYCRTCNVSYELSALTRGNQLEANLDLNRPPAGAWRRNEGTGAVIGATHRSLGTAIGALAISLFWNGIVSVFVLVALSGTLQNLHIPVPSWFPAPVMNGSSMGVGITLFLWIFLTPFIVIGLVMLYAFLSSLAGRTEVHLTSKEGVVFTGIGPLGWRRRFDLSGIRDVRIDERRWNDSDGARQRKTNIVIETREGKLVKFGGMLTEDRRRFVAGAVRRALMR